MSEKLTIESVENLLCQNGAKPIHIARFWRNWYAHRPLDNAKFRFPLPVVNALQELEPKLNSIVRLTDKFDADDEASRITAELVDGEIIECVLLPREGLCVSSQVGCAVGCKFCMTGRSGLIRQLTDLEICSQYLVASKFKPINKIVFMGMGEPSHNAKAVLSAVDHLAEYARIGYKELVVSTVGDTRLFDLLRTREIKPALAISLHSVFDDKRADLLPRAQKIPVSEIMSFAKEYAKLGNYPIQFQWTLIEGVNDSDEEIERLIKLWDGQFAILNMIPINAIEGSDYKRPSDERMDQIKRKLKAAGILLKYRDSAAQEVEGGCGQLRAKKIAHKFNL